MRIATIIACIILASCGGSLSDEQRKQMREKMEENRIVRVTEVEITEAAFAEGRATVETLDSLAADSTQLRSYVNRSGGTIRFLRPGEQTNRLLEKQLIDAYLADPSGISQDNVQKVRNDQGDFDTLLYTKPITKKLPDGADELVGVWNIRLSRKHLVSQLSKSH